MIAAFYPAFGLWIKDTHCGQVTIWNETVQVSLPTLMLSFLLFNGGLGIRSAELREVFHRPAVMFSALAVNLIAPVAFIFAVSVFKTYWHSSDEMQNILVGLALIASMPIAGSSTAWSQNADGNLALSVGLVVLSTLLSPAATPFELHTVGRMTSGDYSWHLHNLAHATAIAFLTLYVAIPVALGFIARQIIGEYRLASSRQHLKLANLINLLLLIYSNAAISLPQTVANPDWDFLALILFITISLCIVMFGSGWLLSNYLKLDAKERTSVVFALGMNNNGAGLVLASLALAQHPRVLLPIIFYNLIQHLSAGIVDAILSRSKG
jgi:BASS family bile acid:Na+ symporter